MTDAVIADLRVRRHRAPLTRPWGESVRSIDVVEVSVETRDGRTGTGFSWTPSIGSAAVAALLENDIREWVIGRPADARTLWPLLWAHLHEAGSGGITTIAMAGLDLALWDLDSREHGASLSEYLGAERSRVTVYGSGVNLHYSLDELRAQAGRWVASGYAAVKMKVGRPGRGEDAARVAAVREIVGDDVALMLDANQRWTLDQAVDAMAELEQFNPAWIEEPLRADDLASHARLRSSIRTPIALGENLHTIYRFREAIEAGACDIVQPNVVRVGGITPFLDIAALADEHGVTLRPHLLPELSGQLALALPTATEVERVEGAGLAELGLLTDDGPVAFDRASLTSAGLPGLGVHFSERFVLAD
ncbi:mandelate racemase/muconate lactonizing enzyme family protein [Paramicrobacterium fandaimingii]|uniref:mandelate racemase/muconate lactonizing enzyme family protein n=1 Tax=Paramicrobacterium fandaimingii TaxID=2708079 RepID=UPI0014239066|nr:mandelate racemase/muconate lactonizing enzyme family protein [Microbacterium fandaimingii]